jgi:hypothetical protein
MENKFLEPTPEEQVKYLENVLSDVVENLVKLRKQIKKFRKDLKEAR